jgi:hypothetical protein
VGAAVGGDGRDRGGQDGAKGEKGVHCGWYLGVYMKQRIVISGEAVSCVCQQRSKGVTRVESLIKTRDSRRLTKRPKVV